MDHVLIEFKMLIGEADMGNDRLHRNQPKLAGACGSMICRGSLSIRQCKIGYMFYIQIMCHLGWQMYEIVTILV